MVMNEKDVPSPVVLYFCDCDGWAAVSDEHVEVDRWLLGSFGYQTRI